jgi:hypothetical protein
VTFSPAQLHVVTAISNPCRYKSRYALYRAFAARMAAAGVTLWTVEAAFGDREHAVTSADDAHHIQVRIHDEYWHKESLLNHGIARLPMDWQYVAWIDADVEFVRDDWATETLHALQHYDVVQPWSHADDLGPHRERIESHTSFCFCHLKGHSYEQGRKYGPFWHPGFAWAARRRAIEGLGGLLDWPILGAADHHMALALVGNVGASAAGGLHPSYYRNLHIYQDRAEAHVRRNIGYVPGLLLHHWHGKKANRQYQERWSILQKHQFDPDTDLKRDSRGLYQLTNRKIGLRDDLRAYFRARNEDSVDA